MWQIYLIKRPLAREMKKIDDGQCTTGLLSSFSPSFAVFILFLEKNMVEMPEQIKIEN